jgi:hypothetical protein
VTVPMTRTGAPTRRTARSAGAVLAGFLLTAVLSLGTDQLFHVLGVYPPWGQPMRETSDNLLALGYRVVYTVLGAYVTARLAPHSPMRHALILGVIGFAAAAAGAIVAITRFDLGPDWYPILLALTALPCCWLGGALHRRRGG